jgi:NADH dehydrogenase [ubiquinone] 1 alpha subcomplex assembly factor 1
MIKYKLLIECKSPEEEKRWEIINDVIMGGHSESRINMTPEKTALFEGEVSLENDGGFASVRTDIGDHFLDGFKGLSVRVRGDGKRYRLRVRTVDAPEGFAYQTSFVTQADTWLTLHMPFSAFEPFSRGVVVPNAPPLTRSDIRQIGLMIADKQPGLFRLEIDWVKAYLDY